MSLRGSAGGLPSAVCVSVAILLDDMMVRMEGEGGVR